MTEDQLARFWTKVQRGPEADCWQWIGAKSSGGYGRFYYDGHLREAHRVSYEQSKGAIPDGLVIDHICRTRACVNPAHLRAVTRYQNVHENSEAVPHLYSLRATCNHGHPLSGDNLIFKGGIRACLECKRIQQAKHVAKKRAGRPLPRKRPSPVQAVLNSEKTECIRGHSLAGHNLVVKPNGKRRCRLCDNAWSRAYRALKKTECHAE